MVKIGLTIPFIAIASLRKRSLRDSLCVKGHHRPLYALACGISLMLIGCQQTAEPVQQGSGIPERNTPQTSVKPSGTQELWPIGEKLLNEAAMASETLNAAIDQLLHTPNATNQYAAKEAWFSALSAIEAFYLFSLLPDENRADTQQDSKQSSTSLARLFNALASWPVESGYLDGFREHRYSGLVFDISVPLTASELRKQHGLTSPSEATLGVYALGTVLFGIENKRTSSQFNADLALSDEQLETGYKTIEELPHSRRRQLIKLQAALLADDVARLRTTFSNKQPNSVASQFEHAPPYTQQQAFLQAAVKMLTQQMLDVSHLQNAAQGESVEWRLWQGQILAERLLAQLSGWKAISEKLALDNKEAIEAETQSSILLLNELLKNLHEQEDNPWAKLFQSLRQLSNRLIEKPS